MKNLEKHDSPVVKIIYVDICTSNNIQPEADHLDFDSSIL